MRGILWGFARVSLTISILLPAVLFEMGGQVPDILGLNMVAGAIAGFLGYFACRVGAYMAWEDAGWRNYRRSDPRHPTNRPWWFPLTV